MVNELSQWVVFRIESQRYALRLAEVERIVRAVEVMPLPQAPEIVLGVINVEGRILPVLNVRQRFGLPAQEIRQTNQFLIARTTRREVVLVIDDAEGIVERWSSEIGRPGSIVPGLEKIQGVVKLDDGLALIYDLEEFLSLDEATALEKVMGLKEARDN
jgi:purine-binding chemotaxis protein CheW